MSNIFDQVPIIRFGPFRPEATEEGRGVGHKGVPFKRVMFVFLGGFGNKTRRALERLAREMGIEIVAVSIDSEKKELADAAKESRVELHTTTLAELAGYPALRERYLERSGLSAAHLQRIPGVGNGGWPQLTGMDINLSITELRAQFRQALHSLTMVRDQQQTNVYLHLDADQSDDDVIGEIQVIFVGGGCGSVGAASLLLLPNVLREVAREIFGRQFELYCAAVVAGPEFYRGRKTPTDKVWASTMAQMEEACLDGFTDAFADGSAIDDPTPIYQRVFLVDSPVAGEVASDDEERAFHADVARMLYVIATGGATGLLGEIEGIVVGQQVYPAWTIVRVVLPFVPEAPTAVKNALVAASLDMSG